MKMRPATPEDFAAIAALLAEASLDASDTGPSRTGDFLLLTEGADVIACGAIERHDRHGLLRSVAVRTSERGRGHAARLVRSLEVHASACGIDEVFLLTMTAATFFVRLHYEKCERSAAPEAIQHSPQFVNLCPASATCMRKQLSRSGPTQSCS